MSEPQSRKQSSELLASRHTAQMVPPGPAEYSLCRIQTACELYAAYTNHKAREEDSAVSRPGRDVVAIPDATDDHLASLTLGEAAQSPDAGAALTSKISMKTGARVESKSLGTAFGKCMVSDKRQPYYTCVSKPMETGPESDAAVTIRRFRPVWRPLWKTYRVISGHLGWVTSTAFDPGNEWFCTGSTDRSIKIWDVASGQLKLTLTGHTLPIRGVAVSSKFPYLFSAGEDKQVKCWDLEYNKVIRSYHGHLSGVYCLSLHPTLDILLTGGRDAVCRVWDMRTKAQVHALSGHKETVFSIMTQAIDPQVVTGSHDTTIKLWDLAAGKSMSTLTHHKKSVRALVKHPFEPSFASSSSKSIKKFRLPKGEFLHDYSLPAAKQQKIVHCMALNEENVLASGGDDGSICFWDWKSGHNFQQAQTIVQPGSLACEAAIYALSFDVTGTRLVTCEADKTIKMWKEDENATPETHALSFRPSKEMRRC